MKNSYAIKFIDSYCKSFEQQNRLYNLKISEIMMKSDTVDEAYKKIKKLYTSRNKELKNFLTDFLSADNCFLISKKRVMILFDAYKSGYIKNIESCSGIQKYLEDNEVCYDLMYKQNKFISIKDFTNLYGCLSEMIFESKFDTVIMPRKIWKELCKLNPSIIPDYEIYNKAIDDDVPIVRCKQCGCEIFKQEYCVYFDENNSSHRINDKSQLVCQGCSKIIRDFGGEK